VAIFSFAVILFGLGECFQGPVQGALVADLAPPRLRGRYMAVSTNSWDLGFLLGPAIGGFILAAEPLALWPLAAVACLAAGAGALSLESRLPPKLRLTPA
jgi:MFS family permease